MRSLHMIFAAGSAPTVMLLWHYGGRVGHQHGWPSSVYAGLLVGAVMMTATWWSGRRRS